MKIKIDDIPEDGLSVDVAAEGAVLSSLAGGLDFSFLSPVTAHLDITGTDDRVFVQGRLNILLSFDCSRCLKPFEYGMDTGFSVYFVKGTEKDREKELKPEDLDVNYLGGDELDTDELLLGQIALEAPMQPLCRPECRGLCHRCGADLNAGPCGCGAGEDRVDSRFARLKDFKVK